MTTLATESTRNFWSFLGLARVTLRHELSRPVAKAPGSAVVLWCADANAGTWHQGLVCSWFIFIYSNIYIYIIYIYIIYIYISYMCIYIIYVYIYIIYVYIYHICVCNCVYNYLIILYNCVCNYIILCLKIYYINLHYTILYCVISYYKMLYHVISYFVLLHYIILYQDVQICYACIVNL